MDKNADYKNILNNEKEINKTALVIADKFNNKKVTNSNSKKKTSFFNISGKNKPLPKPKSLPKLTRKHKNRYLSYVSKILFSIYLFVRKKFLVILNPLRKKLYHERSILIFLNDEKHALRYPINNITIIFFIGTLLTLCYTGFDIYNKQKYDIAFYNSLSEEDKRLYSIAEEYKISIDNFGKALVDYDLKIKGISQSIMYYGDAKNEESSIDRNNVHQLLSETDSNRKIVENFLDMFDRIKKIIPVGSWPVAGGGRITSGYGPRLSPFTREQISYHYGIDIAGPYASPILAVADGVITYSGWRGGYGWLIAITHPHGYETLYGHNSSLVARLGQKVTRGQIIARMGNTGKTTGIHSHFEVRVEGKSVSPNDYLNIRL